MYITKHNTWQIYAWWRWLEQTFIGANGKWKCICWKNRDLVDIYQQYLPQSGGTRIIMVSFWLFYKHTHTHTTAGVINSRFVWISKGMKIFEIFLAKTSIFNQKQQQNDAFYLQNKMFTKDFQTICLLILCPVFCFCSAIYSNWHPLNALQPRSLQTWRYWIDTDNTDTDDEINIFLFLSFQKFAKIQFTFNENRICAACLISPCERVDSGGRM